ncbi:response regulator [Thiomicrospira microaerophila]|uniref:response regulator n=1 Tax=Thiomicrospira microaerophila TaxID=406020 RepID=UPI00200D0BA9|nr:response regulator [Thiomicrospira microaerophila]UQB42293.1 response regulator [Thiomicrospira microaerophila]
MIKLLIVDDELAILKVLKWRLEMAGFQVETAINANEALEKIQTGVYDLVLTDIRMPKVDGLSLIETIKQHNNNLPCIVMSGHADIDIENETHRVGAVGYLHKPVKFDELKQLIEANLV